MILSYPRGFKDQVKIASRITDAQFDAVAASFCAIGDQYLARDVAELANIKAHQAPKSLKGRLPALAAFAAMEIFVADSDKESVENAERKAVNLFNAALRNSSTLKVKSTKN